MPINCDCIVAKNRDYSLDVLKGLLVFGMIYSHVMGDFDTHPLFSIKWFLIALINIITFPGFMFCFGYAYQITYFCNDFKDVQINILKKCN